MVEQLNELKNKLSNFDGEISMDIGTAIDAPHSAHWLLNTNKFVIGVEPNPTNVRILHEGSFRKPNFNYLRLSDNTIVKGGNVVRSFDPNRFHLLGKVAIDDVSGVTKQDFYCTDDRNTGCSSLLEPTPELGLDVVSIESVDVTSLEYILDYIGYDGVIDVIKTDAQGKDFDVIKSLGKYLTKVRVIKSEYNTRNQYKDSNSSSDFLRYMLENDFKLQQDTKFDYVFTNNKHNNHNTNMPTI